MFRGQQNYNHGTIKKLVTIMGMLFDDVYISHKSDDNVTVNETIRVPCAYAGKENHIRALEAEYNTTDGTAKKKVKLTLPRMSFEMTDIQYDSTRQKPNRSRIGFKNISDDEKISYVWTPTPMTVSFSLYIFGRKQSEVWQIIQQIIPNFQPFFSVSYKPIPDVDHVEDINILYTGMGIEDNVYDWQDTRLITYTLNFEFPVNFYTGVLNSKVIKKAIVNKHIGEDLTTDPVEIITIEVDPSDAEIDDDWDILITHG